MTELVPTSTDIERVLVQGDLSKLTPDQRVSYYNSVCKSIGLNPLTRPFDYITLNGKLTLYAKKDAADQLRAINGVSIGKPDIQFQDDLILVTVAARDKNGREDSDIGVVKKSDMRGDVANAIMKAVTKAKRRVTLSLCGLGWLDETEVETIPDAHPVTVAETGEILEARPKSSLVDRYEALRLEAAQYGITAEPHESFETESALKLAGKGLRAALEAAKQKQATD